MRRPRADTLFARMLLAQAVTAIALVLLLAVLFYFERGRTVGRLMAERWAPSLRVAAGLPPAGAPGAQLLVHARREPPASALHSGLAPPGVAALRDALEAHGVVPRDIAFSRGDPYPLIWIEVPGPDGHARWLGFADELLETRLPQRVLVALLLGMAMVAGISAWMAKRLSRPLAALRERIEAHAPGEEAGRPTGLPKGATAEIAAIDSAWHAMRERLARHERERRLLLAGVSHDLRSPLARIRTAAELLPETPELLARRVGIVRNVEVADRLVQSFLDHVRAQELPLDQAVDLAALARQVAAGFLRPEAELQVVGPDRLVLARAHPLLLERVLHNLVDNAFQHGRPPVRVHLQESAGEVVVEVEDAGAGIPEALQPTLLQAFARGDSSRQSPGTGLGLAVVAQVVARRHGRIEFDRRPGSHRVRLRLPL